MAPDGLEIEDDEALLGLGFGEERRAPALPGELSLLPRYVGWSGEGNRQKREREQGAESHDVLPSFPVFIELRAVAPKSFT